ncbi:hypothetical protein SmaMPs15_000086 [Stenotrophomonas maltophilia phage vB_SmaM_Ps15]|uniref:Uncharacterized protein n=1 Tax=Stenotrophomonas maltophilia phage vB_SmaM_Ps15 TaxID=3071007 RepID=A0AAE9JUX8_9CAUD|nr:hypothetical protein PQC01_gp086 [Stenotrophomonas maltophilia phage vB_SmaM_Ps15]UMO77237.1 hypothetical protein SmaMPs15_000086 [Stenotrophomonas maltophilia phage vB_SmaM_Ps15]
MSKLFKLTETSFLGGSVVGHVADEEEMMFLLEHANIEIEEAEQAAIRALAVGETFRDCDGDEWLRIQ